MQLEDTETPRKHVVGVRARGWCSRGQGSGLSHALLRRHQQGVDVLEAFKLRLVDLLHHIPKTKTGMNFKKWKEEEQSGTNETIK